VRGATWFLVSFGGFLCLFRGCAIAAAMKPGEEVTFWVAFEIAWPIAAWLLVLTAAYIVEGLLNDRDS
jgi:hypothetical protein